MVTEDKMTHEQLRERDRHQRIERALAAGDHEFAEWIRTEMEYDDDSTPEEDAEDARISAERIAKGKFISEEEWDRRMDEEFPEDAAFFRRLDEEDAEDARISAERIAQGKFISEEEWDRRMDEEFPEDAAFFRRLDEEFPDWETYYKLGPNSSEGAQFFKRLKAEFPEALHIFPAFR